MTARLVHSPTRALPEKGLIAVCGPTGSGKSVVARFLVMARAHADGLQVYSSDPEMVTHRHAKDFWAFRKRPASQVMFHLDELDHHYNAPPPLPPAFQEMLDDDDGDLFGFIVTPSVHNLNPVIQAKLTATINCWMPNRGPSPDGYLTVKVVIRDLVNTDFPDMWRGYKIPMSFGWGKMESLAPEDQEREAGN